MNKFYKNEKCINLCNNFKYHQLLRNRSFFRENSNWLKSIRLLFALTFQRLNNISL